MVTDFQDTFLSQSFSAECPYVLNRDTSTMGNSLSQGQALIVMKGYINGNMHVQQDLA